MNVELPSNPRRASVLSLENPAYIEKTKAMWRGCLPKAKWQPPTRRTL